MAYKALYRKYRPETFDNMVGQDHIVKTLLNAIKNNKVAHAYIFSGPRGTGKTTTAKLLAKALNCTGEEKPCNECENCIDINNGTHPDVIEIDAASNNGVDEVREIVEKVKYLPIQGKYKVYIIDEIHSMTKEAFNALLKTLEEPPEHVVFILATTDIHKVIPTILSRCQRFDFAKISVNDIAKRISDILDIEQIGYDDQVPFEIAKLADGGMRDALSILDQIVSYANDRIEVKDIYDVYGMVSSSEAIKFLTLISERNTKEVLECAERYINKGIDIKRLTYDLLICVKDALVYSQAKSPDLLDKLDEEQAKELAKNYYGSIAIKVNEILNEANESYKLSTNQKLFFELALLKIINLFNNDDEPVKVKEVVKEVIKEVKVETPVEVKKEVILEKKEEKEVKPTITKEEVKLTIPKDSPSITYSMDEYINILRHGNKNFKEQLIVKWPEIRKYIDDPNTRYVAQLLSDAKIGAANKGFILLYYDFKMLSSRASQIDNLNIIKNFLYTFLGDIYEVYAIDSQFFIEITSEFYKRLQAKKFPELHDIPKIPTNISDIKEKKDEDPAIAKGKMLFGEDLEIK